MRFRVARYFNQASVVRLNLFRHQLAMRASSSICSGYPKWSISFTRFAQWNEKFRQAVIEALATLDKVKIMIPTTYHFGFLRVQDLLLPSFHRDSGEEWDRVERLTSRQILRPRVLCCQVHAPD